MLPSLWPNHAVEDGKGETVRVHIIRRTHGRDQAQDDAAEGIV